MSSNNVAADCLKNEGLKSKVRRINLKRIL